MFRQRFRRFAFTGSTDRARGIGVLAAALLVVPWLFAAPTRLQSADPGPGVALTVAGRTSANVSLASRGQFVVAVWSASLPAGQTDVYAAVSTDGGSRFSTPIRVNTTPGEVNVNGEQPPRVTVSSPGAGAATPKVTVIWTAKGANGTRLLTSRSTDGGRTFARSAQVGGTDAAGNRGWEAIAADAADRVSTVWLDHRALAKQGDQMATMHHDTTHSGSAAAAKPDGVAMAQLSQLYYAPLDPPATPRALTGGVCYCCKTALATGPGNRVAIAWRHVYPGNLRDIAFTISRDGGRTFAAPLRVSEDKWQLEGCPDDGPTIGVDGQGSVHVIWPTLVTERGTPTIALFHSVSRDGIRFSPRARLPTEGVPHHPQMVVTPQGAVVAAWDELAGGRRRIVAAERTLDPKGAPTFRRAVLSTTDVGVYPFVTVTGGSALVAWTSGPPSASTIRIVRAPF